MCSPKLAWATAMGRNRSRCRRLALSLGEALAGDFLWREKVSLCAAIPLWFAWKWHVMQERWCISLHRRRVLSRWHVCVVVPLGFAVSEWCFGGVESRCSIAICNCKVAGGLKSSVFVRSLRSNADFEESVWEQKWSKSFQTLEKFTILHVLRKVTKVIFRGRRSTL